ncbi:MAG TPA: 6-carboxytetrahydropterin synthase [Ignavibacteriales bacterium]|nr:6-carboxytetrahydropterin synthase [Ignavibacteriales bacterium]HOL80980.1 6-carboxytetrahydropterin synthase [Ignavibacteriales bacterium]HOM64715.1 6-carboxytetrahydropterin synthase [Ignavibacteriales bacterium]HPD66753.1 6-carboxytetrahydropterin synthase [Ignavibacteriales bacterium]HPP32760.1 6-carboxytetrahydropterin synthase [Ignavibacteriales bacterium]
MIFITRREVFSAAHKLENCNLNEEKNLELYDKCYSIHGHNYILEVTLAGEINPDTGYLFDLKKLKQIIHQYIISRIDHKFINTDVEFMQNIIPTTENLTIAIFNELKKTEIKDMLYSVKLYETENNYFEYKG